jgi:uncharacterized protein YecE (DUF72 family)
MEFGRVPATELEQINFSLPKEPLINNIILSGKSITHPKIYLGCAKWGRPEWVGKIYPQKTKEKDFLEHYIKHYNCIELNATHYKVYDEKMIQKWANKVGEGDFLFCPKMYQGVTHRGSLADKDFITTEFLKGIMAFQQYLGPIFVQVSDTFSPKRKEELFRYLDSLPKDVQFFLEVRHVDWFADKIIMEELCVTLKAMNMGLVITDTAGRRDCAHMALTLPKAFIRYVGNSLHTSDYTRVDAWIQRMKYWLDNGLEELYFFMHMHDEATSPELTVYLVDQMNAILGTHLKKPQFVPKQNSLF